MLRIVGDGEGHSTLVVDRSVGLDCEREVVLPEPEFVVDPPDERRPPVAQRVTDGTGHRGREGVNSHRPVELLFAVSVLGGREAVAQPRPEELGGTVGCLLGGLVGLDDQIIQLHQLCGTVLSHVLSFLGRFVLCLVQQYHIFIITHN